MTEYECQNCHRSVKNIIAWYRIRVCEDCWNVNQEELKGLLAGEAGDKK